MTVTAWCKANNICEQTYYKNLKLLREEVCNNLPVPLPDTCEKPVAFAKLEVASPIPNTQAAVIIRLPQATLEISEGTSLFLFCGKRRDRMKVLLWEGDGFVLLYKRLENGNFKWPRKESEVKPLSWQEFRWLMEGLELEQKHAIKPAKPGDFC